ncbi:MAG: hypothetical protein Nkreftii_002531 [Candidatus Nitrospira kreftii]|uniref:Uncharacterized protein n=1 Tax=Candidatus Nitrospira kreftii TaxID=2652173 RepID=A0A7S8IZ48_9BACT|nr:MAG: hypothetical protein Nkreftii_002531 [Candidatus Nitrospira kreftii]
MKARLPGGPFSFAELLHKVAKSSYVEGKANAWYDNV